MLLLTWESQAIARGRSARSEWSGLWAMCRPACLRITTTRSIKLLLRTTEYTTTTTSSLLRTYSQVGTNDRAGVFHKQLKKDKTIQKPTPERSGGPFPRRRG